MPKPDIDSILKGAEGGDEDRIVTGDEGRLVIEDERTTYRILSKSVREYHFTVPYNSRQDRVEVGQIFSIKDQDLTFLARVLNIEHSSNYDGHWDTTMRGTQFYDHDQIFNRVIAEPLGCAFPDGAFRKARTLPTKFSPVERAEKEEFGFLKIRMGDIEVGYLRNGSRLVEEIPVSLHSLAMDHHMGVFATTGMGKSNFMKVFAASCMRLAARGESKFGLLIVDPHGEYLKGKRHPSGSVKGLLHLNRYREGLACFSTNKENSSDPGVEELAISESDVRPEDIALLYEWSPPQRDALDAISRLLDSNNWLQEIQSPEGLARMVQDGFKDTTIMVLVRRIKNELERNKYIKSRSSLANILARLQKGDVVLVDIPRLNDRSELFLLSVLSRHILEEYKKDPAEERKNCLITIEEAQRVLGAGSNTSRFESIAREGRKFGVGLCAITQQPKLIDRQLLSQFNTLVVMGLGDRNDRKQLEESAKQDLSSMDIEIQTLEKGEAVVSTLSIPFPVPARIHRFEDYLHRLNQEEREEGLIKKGGFKPFLE
ncbi:MAG: ATP-binding protein [Methanothrix sp.]|uniref:ATP-binding protein n=1 Tax=Methanothrix sp. TaxID=90426 RepID=UPI0025E6F145|nr:ATP-binding protein [Methanothrix sp.]MBK7386803.1 ATP-binding protein [Methanothrix sp.]